MTDLVSGLLAHLDALERERHRAAEEMRQAARMKIGNALGDYVLASIADGLRLCRAHRDLAEAYIAVRDNPDRLTDAALHLSFNLLRQVVETIARGLGVEETADE